MTPTRSGAAHLNWVWELIDPDAGVWKADVVRQSFSLPEADAIFNIPLRAGGGEDVLAWAPEKSRIYNVKSMYRSLMIQNEREALEEGTATETSVSERHMWSRLFKLKVIPNVRVFWWRVMRGIIPAESLLKYRHISMESTCKLCLDLDETLLHALLDCVHVKKFWNVAPDWLDIRRSDLHPLTWKQDILCDPQFSEPNRAKLVSVMWSIWTSHNNLTHDRGPTSQVQSVIMTRDALALLDIPRELAHVLPRHGWRPPDQEVVKNNTDGSVALGAGRGSGGGVARSHNGFLAAWCKPFSRVTDPLTVEALALREGVLFERLRGYSKIVMEIDCLDLVYLWNLRHNSRSVVAPILE
ncbi:Alanyl-tRNA synthetase [Hordeum vulgare]|nr:Alanyl-tRNA synthetase [Hordeum vulgare]KAE8801203.1 Alanyl-tRNA synthetase [Hordeum vulgare]